VVIVASVFFSLPAILILFLLRRVVPRVFPDLQELAEQPAKYSAGHLANVIGLIVAVVALAVAMAVIWHLILQLIQRLPRVTRDPVWFELMAGRGRAEGSKAVALSVELTNGACIEGAVKAHGLNKDTELEWLVLESHSKWPLRSRSPNGSFQDQGEGWSYVVISAEEIRTATVAYLDTRK